MQMALSVSQAPCHSEFVNHDNMLSNLKLAAEILHRGITNEEKMHLRQKLLSHLREENDKVLIYAF